MTPPDLRSRVVKALRTVRDPELPVNLYDLGLMYSIDIDGSGGVRIVMTLTAPNCPVADQIPRDVERAVRAVEGVTDVSVTLTFDPPWTTDRMSEEAQLELEALGIDPRRPNDHSGGRAARLTIGRKPTKP